MHKFKSSINESKNFSNLSIKDVEPKFKINLRGKNREFLKKVGQLLSIILPYEPNTSASNQEISILWLGPDEWLIYSNQIDLKKFNTIGESLYTELYQSNKGAVTYVSDQYTCINIKGDKFYDLISKNCPLDLSIFEKNTGNVCQTIINGIDVIIHQIDSAEFNIFIRRSFAKHLYLWLCDTASRL
tara:strand:+ start:73 stop:630 length:558 start_codon:yes stop_codon:yes gene_type:complete